MAWFSTALDLLRKVDRLLTIEAKHADAIENLQERISKLEADRALLIAEANASASAAASAMAGHHMADIARRVGILEERTRDKSPSARKRRLTDES